MGPITCRKPVFWLVSFFGVFAKLRRATIYFVICVRSVCPSVHSSVYPHVITLLLLNGFSSHLVFQYFSKMCRKIQAPLKYYKNCYVLLTVHVSISKWTSGAPDGHLQTVTIPDVVLKQFGLLMMSMTLLETCRGL